MGCQGKRCQDVVQKRCPNRDATGSCEKAHGESTVGHEYPDHKGHDGSSRVRSIEPNTVFIGGARGAFPGKVVEGVFVVQFIIVFRRLWYHWTADIRARMKEFGMQRQLL